jgi:hypothetical protein
VPCFTTAVSWVRRPRTPLRLPPRRRTLHDDLAGADAGGDDRGDARLRLSVREPAVRGARRVRRERAPVPPHGPRRVRVPPGRARDGGVLGFEDDGESSLIVPRQTEYIPEAVKALSAAEAGAKRQAKLTRSGKQTGRFPAGLEWEVVSADTTILNGVTNVLRYGGPAPLGGARSADGPAARRTWGTSSVCESCDALIDVCVG